MNIQRLCAIVIATTVTTSPIIYAQGVTTTPSSLPLPEPVTTAPAELVTPATPAAPQDNTVGISSRDGISFSGTDVIVTRNGVSQRLTQQMELPNGIRVMPDGSFSKSNGDKMMLRSGQIMGFDGTLIDAPVTESRTTDQATQARPAGSTATK